MSIIPLEGYCVASPDSELQSLETETASAMGLYNFVVVDSKTGRGDSSFGKKRVRKFTIQSVYEQANKQIQSYIGKHAYCSCYENEKENDIIVDKDTGNKLWFIPMENILGFEKEN